MAKIAFLLLCHKRPDRVLEQVRILTGAGDCVVVHADQNAGPKFRDDIARGIAGNDHAVLARAVKCGWGEWSLVQATLNMIEAGIKAFPDATHFFLISGDCMPVKPAEYVHAALDPGDMDWIEHADFFEDNWIKTGLKEDRLIYRHWFNERSSKKLFYLSLEAQQKMGLARKIPKGLRMRIGSQWWVLRRETIEKIRAFLRKRRDIIRFFRTTWIPDETFFQTLVMATVPKTEVISKPPTFLMFTDYGMPVTFCADHYELLRAEDAFFARKVSDHDDRLRQDLGALFQSGDAPVETTSTGRAHYDYVRQQGRVGRRFARRIWETGARLGPDRSLVLIVCKKWHVAKRIVSELAQIGGLPAYAYVFDEDDAWLPPLGNLEGSREKRSRHRRAFLRVLYDHHGTDRLAVCIDPGNVATIRDFAEDGCHLTVLDVSCDISDDWLTGHAERVGLGGRAEAGALHAQLLATLRNTIEDEAAALRHMGLAGYRAIEEGDTPGHMARPIAEALGISVDQGAKIARIDGLFD